MQEKLNHLQDEHSPYLLQHVTNPVDWYPWSDEVLSKAAAEDKLLVISIGYAACHWCHVMAHESFEDQEVAEVMNQNYISVKVDREERPDIDQVYMDAAYIITGRGGWPLNIIALPDGNPVFAGTYFNKRDWLYLLRMLADAYRDKRNNLLNDATSIRQELSKFYRKDMYHAHLDFPDPDDVFLKWERILDSTNGGTKGSPKFPMPVNLDYLLHYGFKRNNKAAAEAVMFTLDKMAMGGIYDHLGGGFSRYSTDALWNIPHFEKMLYDNAQLISVYSDAYRCFKKPLYADVVKETIEFVQRELTSPEGLFYSSLDADSEGREGAFYSWKAGEIRQILKDDASDFMNYFSVKEEGNWEKGENVLMRKDNDSVSPDIKKSCRILFEERMKRPRPALDYKILTSWNAMMISAYVEAYGAFNIREYLEKALIAADKISEKIKDNGSIVHSVNAMREIPGFLEDYAMVIRCFTGLYQVTFDIKWLEKAEKMLIFVLGHFSHKDNVFFWFTSSADTPLFSRKTDTGDNVIPSSNSVMAWNLMILGHLLSKEKYTERSHAMVSSMSSAIMDIPYHHALWAKTAMLLDQKPFEISITGKEWKNFLTDLQKSYLPDVIFSGGEKEDLEILKSKVVEGKTVIYVCHDRTCSAPVDSTEAVYSMIH